MIAHLFSIQSPVRSVLLLDGLCFCFRGDVNEDEHLEVCLVRGPWCGRLLAVVIWLETLRYGIDTFPFTNRQQVEGCSRASLLEILKFSRYAGAKFCPA